MLLAPQLALASLLLGAPPSGPLLVERVVARVDSTAITQSALTAEARLVLLDARNPRLAIDAELTRTLLAAVLRSMVDRALLVNEMRRLQLRPAPDEEILVDLGRLAGRFEDREGFFAFLVDIGLVDPGAPEVAPFRAPAGIVDRLRVEREVTRFVDVRIRPSLVISERELRACYAANPEALGRLTFAEAEPHIRLRLRAQKEERALRALLEQLRRRARIWIEPAYDLPAPDSEPDPLGFSCPERGG